jgi:hypothetical protein
MMSGMITRDFRRKAAHIQQPRCTKIERIRTTV